jgi:hypothetical protein
MAILWFLEQLRLVAQSGPCVWACFLLGLRPAQMAQTTAVRRKMELMITMAMMTPLFMPFSAGSLRAWRVKWVGEAVLALNAVVQLLLDVFMALTQHLMPRMTLDVMVTLRQGAVEVMLVVVLGTAE